MPKRGKGHPSYNPRCPKCGCTSSRVARGVYRCRVLGCMAFFKAKDPDLSKIEIQGLDRATVNDGATVALERGIPPDNPHCPVCGGTSAKRDSGLKCRVLGCGHEFPDPRDAPN